MVKNYLDVELALVHAWGLALLLPFTHSNCGANHYVFAVNKNNSNRKKTGQPSLLWRCQ